MAQFSGAEGRAEGGALSKPRITDLGGLLSNRAIAANIAAARRLHGQVERTNRAQHAAHAKL